MNTETFERKSSVNEANDGAGLAASGGYALVYACFFADGEIIGFTKTAEDACEWASRVAANNKGVRIIKIYEIKNSRSA